MTERKTKFAKLPAVPPQTYDKPNTPPQPVHQHSNSAKYPVESLQEQCQALEGGGEAVTGGTTSN